MLGIRIWQIMFGLALGAAVMQTLRIEGFLWFPGLDDTLAAERASHQQTKLNYTLAQRDAQAAEDRRVAEVQLLQEKHNATTQLRFDGRLDALAGSLERLRQARATAVRSPGGQPVPGVPPAAGGVAATPPEDGLSDDERYECSVSATQLDELITWVTATAAGGE